MLEGVNNIRGRLPLLKDDCILRKYLDELETVYEASTAGGDNGSLPESLVTEKNYKTRPKAPEEQPLRHPFLSRKIPPADSRAEVSYYPERSVIDDDSEDDNYEHHRGMKNSQTSRCVFRAKLFKRTYISLGCSLPSTAGQLHTDA